MSFNYAEVNAIAPWFFPAFACMLGACVGSFLNVVIYRVPAGKSVVTPGSHCGCGAPIRWFDNIPIVSWLLLRGRARCCGRAFSVRYPFVELLTALLFLACWLRFPPAVALCGWVLVSALIGATFIDLGHFIIPEVFTVGLAIAGLGLSFLVPALHGTAEGSWSAAGLHALRPAVFGFLIGSAIVFWMGEVAAAVLKKEAMGFGDVKFVGAIGTFCGWQGALFAIFGGAIVGTIWVLFAWVWQRVAGKSSPVAPPIEEGEPEPLPALGWLDVFALGGSVLAVMAAFAVPRLQLQTDGIFLIDSARSGVAALRGLLLASGAVLWLVVIVEAVARRDLVPRWVVLFAGAFGALVPWSLGWRGLAQGAIGALLAGALALAGGWLLHRLRGPAGPTPEPADAETPGEAEPQLGFGVHVPFGPMLAIAGGVYFLFGREFVLEWLAQFTPLFGL